MKYLSLRGWHHPLSSYPKNGYTLVEALVAVLIFSAMVSLSVTALNQGLKQYHNLMERGLNFWENAKYLWLNKSLNSAVDYYVHSRDKGWFPYFDGRQDAISYVSLAPLAGDKPVLAWIINERLNDGSRALIYYEVPVYSMKLKDIERQYVFEDFKKGKSIPLLKEIQNVEIKFYGYDIKTHKWIWTRAFNGRERKLLPEVIRIDYRKKGSHKKKALVFGINVNSMYKMVYNELYGQE